MKAITIILILFPFASLFSIFVLNYIIKKGKKNANKYYPPANMHVIYRNWMINELKNKCNL